MTPDFFIFNSILADRIPRIGRDGASSIPRVNKKRAAPFPLDRPFVLRAFGMSRDIFLAHRVCRPRFSASASEKTAGSPAKRIEFCERYKSIHSHLLRPRAIHARDLALYSSCPIIDDHDSVSVLPSFLLPLLLFLRHDYSPIDYFRLIFLANGHHGTNS